MPDLNDITKVLTIVRAMEESIGNLPNDTLPESAIAPMVCGLVHAVRSLTEIVRELADRAERSEPDLLTLEREREMSQAASEHFRGHGGDS